ncbi:MAG: hypothetical protein N2381_05785 [Armatimonadetes bacterium]|nr:hypothetical protein [Armatimonadota bacterium]
MGTKVSLSYASSETQADTLQFEELIHEHQWEVGQPIFNGMPPTVEKEYIRRGEIIFPLHLPIGPQVDMDECVVTDPPCPLNNEAANSLIIEWKSNIGGEFGHYDPQTRIFTPTDDPYLVNAYLPPKDFIGIVIIWVRFDDVPICNATGEPTANDDDVDSVPVMITVWEFEITPVCPEKWGPKPYETLTFTATIRPMYDHYGNSLAGKITFQLFETSHQPGFCLNACCAGGYDKCGDDRCPIYPYCSYDISIFPQCTWHQELLLNGQTWLAMTVWDSDLKFPPDQEGFIVNEPVCTEAKTINEVTDATIKVMCLDYGAFGKLKATCLHPILSEMEIEITARLPFNEEEKVFIVDDILADPENGDYDVRIPYDRDLDGIADDWQKKHGRQYANAFVEGAPTDRDDTPSGNGTQGDGLSAYEEYRGLLVRGTWRDLDPKVKDMFVMNFGAVPRDPENGDWNFVIPNEAITSNDGFPGQGVPGENNKGFWLLNANEGETVQQTRRYRDDQGNVHNILLTGKLINYLHGYAHIQDVYAAVVVPGSQLLAQNSLAETFGPIWNVEGLPVIEIDVRSVEAQVNSWNRVGYNYDLLHALACLIAHELGHTILWDVDHNPYVQHGQDQISILTSGDWGHHVYQQHRMCCFMWPYFPPGLVPDLDGDGNFDSLPFPNLPTDFCDSHPGCQFLWHLNPKKKR